MPSTIAREDLASTQNSSMLRSDEVKARSVIVLDPTTKVPDAWRLMMIPSTVTAGPPADVLENVEGLGVKIWPAIVNGEIEGVVDDGVESETVELPIANTPE